MTEIPMLIVEDGPVARRAIAAKIDADPQFTIAEAVGMIEAAREALERPGIALALLDLRLPDGQAVSLVPRARSRGVAVLVFTVSDEASDVFDALAAGAAGYLLKADALATVADALHTLRDGGAPISPRTARRLIDEFARHAREAVPAPDADAQLTARERDVIDWFALGATCSRERAKWVGRRHSLRGRDEEARRAPWKAARARRRRAPDRS